MLQVLLACGQRCCWPPCMRSGPDAPLPAAIGAVSAAGRVVGVPTCCAADLSLESSTTAGRWRSPCFAVCQLDPPPSTFLDCRGRFTRTMKHSRAMGVAYSKHCEGQAPATTLPARGACCATGRLAQQAHGGLHGGGVDLASWQVWGELGCRGRGRVAAAIKCSAGSSARRPALGAAPACSRSRCMRASGLKAGACRPPRSSSSASQHVWRERAAGLYVVQAPARAARQPVAVYTRLGVLSAATGEL